MVSLKIKDERSLLEVIDYTCTDNNLLEVAKDVLNLAAEIKVVLKCILDTTTKVDTNLTVAVALERGLGVVKTCQRICVELILYAKIEEIVEVSVKGVSSNVVLLEPVSPATIDTDLVGEAVLNIYTKTKSLNLVTVNGMYTGGEVALNLSGRSNADECYADCNK